MGAYTSHSPAPTTTHLQKLASDRYCGCVHSLSSKFGSFLRCPLRCSDRCPRALASVYNQDYWAPLFNEVYLFLSPSETPLPLPNVAVHTWVNQIGTLTREVSV